VTPSTVLNQCIETIYEGIQRNCETDYTILIGEELIKYRAELIKYRVELIKYRAELIK
jgi:hypothetical protein